MANLQANIIVMNKGQKTFGTKEEDIALYGYVEIDFGPKPVGDGHFTVYDDRVNAGTRVICNQLYEAATGKDLDESAMDSLHLICGASRAGSFELLARAEDYSYVEGAFVIGYTLINNDEAAESADDMLIDSNEL